MDEDPMKVSLFFFNVFFLFFWRGWVGLLAKTDRRFWETLQFPSDEGSQVTSWPQFSALQNIGGRNTAQQEKQPAKDLVWSLRAPIGFPWIPLERRELLPKPRSGLAAAAALARGSCGEATACCWGCQCASCPPFGQVCDRARPKQGDQEMGKGPMRM